MGLELIDLPISGLGPTLRLRAHLVGPRGRIIHALDLEAV